MLYPDLSGSTDWQPQNFGQCINKNFYTYTYHVFRYSKTRLIIQNMPFLKPIRPLLTSTYQMRFRDQLYPRLYQIRRSTVTSSTHTSPKPSRRYVPYLYDFLLYSILGSEALHILWLKQEYAEYKEKTDLKIEVLQKMVEKLEKGDQLDENVEEKMREALDDETELEKLIMSLALEQTPESQSKKEDTSIQSKPNVSSESPKKPLYL